MAIAGIAGTLRRASDSVEDFRGDFDRLAAMMEASWTRNPTPPFIYSAAFLADFFGYPGAGFTLAPTIYVDSDPVAFAAGHPRRVMADGAERNVLIATLLSVAPEWQASGYGIVVWSELLRRAAEAGFDGVVNHCVAGEAMDRMIGTACHRLGLPLLKAVSFTYLAKSMWIPPAGPVEPRPAPSVHDLMSAAAQLPASVQFARLWTEAEAAWELSRHGVIAVRAESDARPAVLTGYMMSIADAVRTRCLVIQEILWGDLEADQRAALVQALLAAGARAGARMAFMGDVGYADIEPFAASGFVAAEHLTHAYLTMWSDPFPSRPPAGYYLDQI